MIRVLLLSALLASSLATAATKRISLGLNGAEADGASFVDDISPDGRYVVFSSTASNLVEDDTNNFRDVFVYDTAAETIILVSKSSAGDQGNHDSNEASISDDGRFVCFTSTATNLVSGDANGVSDVFRHDLLTSQTIRVSLLTGTSEANGPSTNGQISGSGFVVTFQSTSSNLVSGDSNGVMDVFVRYLNTSLTSRVSVDVEGFQAAGSSSNPSISQDGTIIAFQATSDLLSGDSNGVSDIYVWDLEAVTLKRASVGPAGEESATLAAFPDLSADGNLVVFSSRSTTFGPATEQTRIYVKNLETGTIEHVSVSSTGLDGNADSEGPRISATGRYVSFSSHANNLVGGDTNGVNDLFVRDRTSAKTSRVSVTAAGGQSSAPEFSYFAVRFPVANPGTVAFSSAASDLVPGDTAGFTDAFTGSVVASVDNSALVAKYRAEIKKLLKQIKTAKKKKQASLVKKLTKKLKRAKALLAGL